MIPGETSSAPQVPKLQRETCHPTTSLQTRRSQKRPSPSSSSIHSTMLRRRTSSSLQPSSRQFLTKPAEFVHTTTNTQSSQQMNTADIVNSPLTMLQDSLATRVSNSRSIQHTPNTTTIRFRQEQQQQKQPPTSSTSSTASNSASVVFSSQQRHQGGAATVGELSLIHI